MSRKNETIGIKAARNLTTTHKTRPMMLAKSPKYLLKLLPWINVPGATYRINQVKLSIRGEGRVDINFTDDGPVITPDGLRAIPLFQSLTDELASEMVQHLMPESASRGSEVATEGEDHDKLFVLVSGNAALSRKGDRGEELRIKTIGPGDFFGEEELALDAKAAATVRTTTDCVFVTLSAASLGRVFKERPELKEELDRSVAYVLLMMGATNDYGEQKINMSAGQKGVVDIPATHVDYIEEPNEIELSLVQTVLQAHTRVTDLYNNPVSQLQMQMFITASYMYERQEWEILNNPEFGLVTTCAPGMRLQPIYGPPTPDDLDAMLALVWKNPSCFLLHPRALAAFQRECTFRGVPPTTVEMLGGTFICWRGIPLIPTEKLEIDGHILSQDGPGKTQVLLIRAGGEDSRGVAGLHQIGIPGEIAPSLSIRQMNIDQRAVASYLMTLYFSVAVHAADAVAVLENVEVGFHHQYDGHGHP